MRQLNFSGEEILETITMVRTEQLDIRTITVGISLLDCVSENPDALCRNVYEKIERTARSLQRVSAEISEEFGLPIINNRPARPRADRSRQHALVATPDRARWANTV